MGYIVLYSTYLDEYAILSILNNILIMNTTQKKVSIYTTPTCGYCKMAKEYFKEKNVSYEEYDVAVDAIKRQEMFDKTHQMGVPVVQIGEEFVVGFDKNKIEGMLA